MKRPPLLIVLLVVVHVCVLLWSGLGGPFSPLLGWIVGRLESWIFDPFSIGFLSALASLVISIIATQVTLMSMWLVLGRFHWLARLGFTVGVSLVWCAFLTQSIFRGHESISIAFMVDAVVVLAVLRVFGFTVVDREELRTTEESPQARRQFTILQMLIGMTVAAIGFGLLKAYSRPQDLLGVVLTGLYSFLLMPGPVAALWLALGCRHKIARIIVFALSTVLSGMVLWLLNEGSEDPSGVVILIGGTTSFSLLSLLVVRKCGYRFVRLPVEAFDESAGAEKEPPDAMSDGLG